MKAVIYARYSSDNQREESIEGQIRECTAFAEKNGITILRHYIDRAFSAKTDNRPEFQNMIKDSGKRLFDMIIVWKLDRFARNRYDSARYKTALKKNGVKVVSATEVISDGAEGIILESVLEGYAEYYSADLSEKVVRGMTENALKSKYNGGTRPIGYLIDNDQYFQIDPLTAPFVREAFQRYDEGATMTQIRDWLNEQGVKNTRGQKMTYNSVQHLLNNRRYIGEYTYRDVVVPDGIPAIVPQDLFDRVQQKLAKNKKAPARHKAEDEYLLTTKLFCGYCEAYLYGESGTSHTGNIHRYYKCISVKKKRANCRKKSVRKEWIEDLVVTETMKMVMDDTAIEAIVSMLMDLQDRENVNLPLYEQQLREADTAIQNLLNAIQQGILTKSTKGRLEELEATKEELETRIACEKLAKPKVSAEFMTFWLHRFRKLDVRQKSHRKMLIDTFINAIFLYDDKMVITFNYKEGTMTITFDDLKAALDGKNMGSDLDCLTAPNQPGLNRGRAFFAPAKGAPNLSIWSPFCFLIAVQGDGAVVRPFLDGLDHRVIPVTLVDLDVDPVPHPFPQQGLAHGGLLADEAVQRVLTHGGDDLVGLGLAVLLQIDRHPVVEAHRPLRGAVPDNPRGFDHVLQEADAALVAVFLLLGGLVLKILAEIAKPPGLLDRLQQLGPEGDAAVVQLLPHHLDVLLRQFVVHMNPTQVLGFDLGL